MKSSCVVLAAGAMVLAVAAVAAHGAPRGALWMVVRACVLDSRMTGRPCPCLSVDRRAGIAVVADPKRRTQVLVTPTIHVAGIESPALQSPDAPNYWRAAWEMRGWLDRRAGRTLSAENVGLAVNSVPGRTQDQLHIHLDCLRPSVRRRVDADIDGVGDTWADLPTPLTRGHRYRARWLAQAALQTTDPFRLLAADRAVEGDLGAWTLVMVAARRPSGAPGFVLLSHRADLAELDLAAGEELLDHHCRVPGVDSS